MTRKGKIVGEPVLIILLFIESLPLASLSFNCVIHLDTSSPVKGESSAEFCFIHLGCVGLSKFLLSVVFSLALKDF